MTLAGWVWEGERWGRAIGEHLINVLQNYLLFIMKNRKNPLMATGEKWPCVVLYVSCATSVVSVSLHSLYPLVRNAFSHLLPNFISGEFALFLLICKCFIHSPRLVSQNVVFHRCGLLFNSLIVFFDTYTCVFAIPT